MVNSALIGQPPLTDDDYWFIKGSQLLAGKSNLDPRKGLRIPPLRPPPDQYHFETRGPAIIAVSAVLVSIMFIVTVARFMLRKFMKELRFGWDDWLMIPALVRHVLLAPAGDLDNVTSLTYWTEVDITLSVIVASMPVLGTAIWRRSGTSRRNKPSNDPSSGFRISKPKSGDKPLSEHSREGIMRQDDVELQYQSRGPLDLEESMSKPEHMSQDAYHVERQTMPWASARRI
ncbi:MAG: hypothetical protein Q9186_004286 [Xanthomendoza sp. 1 TL-2023]